MSILIILKNHALAYKECNFCQYWDFKSCIHPEVGILIWTQKVAKCRVMKQGSSEVRG